MYVTLASRDIDCCLILESPFYLEGSSGLYEYIEERLKENSHMVIVIAEGAGQELLPASMQFDKNIKVCLLFILLKSIVNVVISQYLFDKYSRYFLILNLSISILQDYFFREKMLAITPIYIGM